MRGQLNICWCLYCCFQFKIDAQDLPGLFLWVGRMPALPPSDRVMQSRPMQRDVYTTGSFSGTTILIRTRNIQPDSHQYRYISDRYVCTEARCQCRLVWAKQLVGESSSAGYAIVLDQAANVYITGYFRGTKDFNLGPGVYNLTADNADIFVMKLGCQWYFLWARNMSGSSNEGGFGIALDDLSISIL
jgi:hypothetical protein